jgi:small subunit ribosomal protein S16
MAVKIRLSRIGKKNAPFYRIVAVDERKKRDGACLEDLGTYNPVNGTLVTFNAERVDAWVAQGAIKTDVVKRLYKNYKKVSGTAV